MPRSDPDRRSAPARAGRARLHQASQRASSAPLARAASAALEAAAGRAAVASQVGRRDRLGGVVHEYYAIAA
jgi:hypothetical protein